MPKIKLVQFLYDFCEFNLKFYFSEYRLKYIITFYLYLFNCHNVLKSEKCRYLPSTYIIIYCTYPTYTCFTRIHDIGTNMYYKINIK